MENGLEGLKQRASPNGANALEGVRSNSIWAPLGNRRGASRRPTISPVDAEKLAQWLRQWGALASGAEIIMRIT